MRYGKSIFKGVGRVHQETVDREVRKLAAKYKGELTDLEMSTQLMKIGYRVEWHNMEHDAELSERGIVWQADIHPPMGS